MGGGDEPSNLFECSVEEHANLHLDLYLTHGHWEDWIACQSLSGQMGREEAQSLQCKLMGLANKGQTRQPLTEEHKEKIRQGQQRKPYHRGYCYEITYVDGTIEVIQNLRKFCRERPREKLQETRSSQGNETRVET